MLGQPSISDYYRQLEQEVRSDVMRETEEQILGTDPEELAQYIFEKYALSPIELDADREPSWDPQNYLKTISAQQRGNFYGSSGDLRDFPCQKVAVEVPILPNPKLHLISQMHGASYSLSYSLSDFHWGQDSVSMSFPTKDYQYQMDDAAIAHTVENQLRTIHETISSRNQAIEQGNKQLLTQTKFYVQQRRGEIEQNKQKLEALTKTIGVSLKKKVPAGAHPVRISHTPLVQRVKPKPTLPEQYVLDENKIDDVINLLDNQARSFEQTPGAFKALGEEDLRDILLSNLNSVFEGAATGETFSKKGKTDIYLKIAKGQILICECKLWAGRSLYEKTIDQLRGYLTWRHNYGIMITFVRNKDFSKVLQETENAIQEHPSYLNGLRKIGETHFVSNHKVDDDTKEVKIHHLFYHLYSS